MVHLTLAGLSEDGRRLLLVSDAGVEFTLDVDARLRAALRGDHARLGQLEIEMDSALRPRDIQARIRAGHSPETVAAAAQTSVDKIMPYAAPVLAEREHIAQRAQRASIRRPSAGATAATGTRTLGDAVAAHLRAHDVDPGHVTWDAWRREDGRWSLRADYACPDRSGQAAFTFDAPGNYVSADDEHAHWLIGDLETPSASLDPAPQGATDLAAARRRRLTGLPGGATSADELPLGEDALDLVSESGSLGAEAPVEAYLDGDPGDPDPDDLQPEDLEPEDLEPEDLEPTEPLETIEPVDRSLEDDEPADRPARRKGRASVPSWDEIMFGGGKHD